MKVGAVVLHHRHWPGVRGTLDALLAQTRRPDSVLVVDNQSDDGSVARIHDAFRDVEIIEAGENRGYAAGMNLGIRFHLARGADAVLLLTHECRLARDALEALMKRMAAAPGLGAVGPLLADLSEPDRVFSAGGRIDARTWTTAHVREPPSLSDWAGKPPQPAEWLDGAALLIRTDVVEDVGMLDEGYFLYFEETEYLLRVRAAGWEVECLPGAIAWQASGGKPPYLWTRNRLRFLWRMAPKRKLIREVLVLTRSLVRSSMRAPLGEDRAEIRARIRGLTDFLLQRWGPDPTATRITTERGSVRTAGR